MDDDFQFHYPIIIDISMDTWIFHRLVCMISSLSISNILTKKYEVRLEKRQLCCVNIYSLLTTLLRLLFRAREVWWLQIDWIDRLFI